MIHRAPSLSECFHLMRNYKTILVINDLTHKSTSRWLWTITLFQWAHWRSKLFHFTRLLRTKLKNTSASWHPGRGSSQAPVTPLTEACDLIHAALPTPHVLRYKGTQRNICYIKLLPTVWHYARLSQDVKESSRGPDKRLEGGGEDTEREVRGDCWMGN